MKCGIDTGLSLLKCSNCHSWRLSVDAWR